MTEYGIFNDDSVDYSAEEALEVQFYSIEAAEKAIADRYNEEDDVIVHEVEEPEEDEEDDSENDDEDDAE